MTYPSITDENSNGNEANNISRTSLIQAVGRARKSQGGEGRGQKDGEAHVVGVR